MKNKQQYEKNLYLNIIYCYLRYTLFFIPIFTPFLLANNISYSQIFFLHFLFGLTVLILEIPFGYLTDRVGRKVGLIIASFLFSSGFFLYGIGSLYWQFVIAEILFGIGYAFYSGTYNAIVYDSLLHLKREKEYKKWEGYMLGAQRGAEIVAAFVTGYIVVHGMHLTFYFSIIPFIVAIPVVLMMKEPKIKKEPIGIGHWHHMGKVVRAAYDHPGVFWFSVYSSVITGTMLGAIWLFQTLWTTYNIPITFFGFLWMATQIASGSGSLSSHRLGNIFGLHFSLFGVVLLLFLGLLLSALLPGIYAIVAMCLCCFVWGFSIPLCNDAINRYIVSSRRATVLSFKAVLTRIFQLIFQGMIAVILLSMSLSFSLVVLGVLFGVIGGYSLYRLHDLGVL